MHYTEERRLGHGRKTTQTDTQNKFKVTKIKCLRLKKILQAYKSPSQQGHGGNTLMANDSSKSGYKASWRDGSEEEALVAQSHGPAL